MRQGYVVTPAGLGLALLCSAANLRDVEKLRLECRAAKPKACDKLALLARSDGSPYVRAKAIEAIEDQRLLVAAATSDADINVRCAALKKVTDVGVLRETAKNGKDRLERDIAIQSPLLVDLALMQELAGADPDPANRRTAANRARKLIETSSDQPLLAKIAMSDDREGATLAVKRLTDPAFLMDVARTARTPSVRYAAVSNPAFDDQRTLYDLALTADDASLRSKAASVLRDPALLAELARSAKDLSVRQGAVAHLEDQALLADLALTATDENVRKTASKRVTDDVALSRLVRESSDVTTRREAVAKLKDTKLLAAVAKDDKDPEVRRVARLTAAKVTPDPAAVARIARTDAEVAVRIAAVQNPKLSDPAVLASIAKTDKELSVSAAAIDRLEDGPTLRALAAAGAASGRVVALARLKLVTSHACVRERHGVIHPEVSVRWEDEKYGKPGSNLGTKYISREGVMIELTGSKPLVGPLRFWGEVAEIETFSSYEFSKTRAATVGFTEIWAALKAQLLPEATACLVKEAGLSFIPK